MIDLLVYKILNCKWINLYMYVCVCVCVCACMCVCVCVCVYFKIIIPTCVSIDNLNGNSNCLGQLVSQEHLKQSTFQRENIELKEHLQRRTAWLLYAAQIQLRKLLTLSLQINSPKQIFMMTPMKFPLMATIKLFFYYRAQYSQLNIRPTRRIVMYRVTQSKLLSMIRLGWYYKFYPPSPENSFQCSLVLQ